MKSDTAGHIWVGCAYGWFLIQLVSWLYGGDLRTSILAGGVAAGCAVMGLICYLVLEDDDE